jgi:hypothetical protein
VHSASRVAKASASRAPAESSIPTTISDIVAPFVGGGAQSSIAS